MSRMEPRHLGKILLISSGETSSSAHDMFNQVFQDLRPPVRVAILETPAGFEVNSEQVSRKVADFLETSLKNFHPVISVVPARRRDGHFSTNNAEMLAPVLEADCIYMGAGSPTYLVRHMKDTLAWDYLNGKQRSGALLCVASAAAIALGSKALPVYEIYKAGHDLHWADGLDLFGAFGLDLAIVSHWDNREGGAQLDTSHCFMGRSRMEELRKLLSPGTVILGIDEHTGVVFDFESDTCHVVGKAGVTILVREMMETYTTGQTFSIERLGAYHRPVSVPIPTGPVRFKDHEGEVRPSQEVLDLIAEREAARKDRDWPRADFLRQRIAELGFEVQDTPAGPHCRHTGN